MSFTKPEVHPHSSAYNRLVQCLQSIVCPCRVPLHGPVQFEIIRGIRFVGHMFSSKIAPSPWDFVTLPEEDRATAIAWDFVTLPEEDRATAIGNMYGKFGKDRACVSGISSRTDTQTYTQTYSL